MRCLFVWDLVILSCIYKYIIHRTSVLVCGCVCACLICMYILFTFVYFMYSVQCTGSLFVWDLVILCLHCLFL